MPPTPPPGPSDSDRLDWLERHRALVEPRTGGWWRVEVGPCGFTTRSLRDAIDWAIEAHDVEPPPDPPSPRSPSP